MSRLILLFLLLLYLIDAERDDFLCVNCGQSIFRYSDLIDKQAEDSERKELLTSVGKDYIVKYDVFPETKNGEITNLIYSNYSYENKIVVLPEKVPSTHFLGYYYQKVLCKHCREFIGYLITPTNGILEPIHPITSDDESMVSLLDFCPYTKCWDVASAISEAFAETGSIKMKKKKQSIVITPEFTISEQITYSDMKFDLSFLGLFTDDSEYLFGYDYAFQPPQPFFSVYVSPAKEPIHIDLENPPSQKVSILEIHVKDGEGMTEIRFVHCYNKRDLLAIDSIWCRSKEDKDPKYCLIRVCVGDFAILKRRRKGSFFAFLSNSTILDNPVLENELDSLDDFQYLFNYHSLF